MADNRLPLIASDQLPAVDDCWNRIGIHGDKSCERLAAHVHCRNCEVHAAAATLLLDRYALIREDTPSSVDDAEEDGRERRSTLVFRLGEQWLGIATRSLVEVAALNPIHSLPHQRALALLGVTNVRGALVACLSLVELLGLEKGTEVNGERRVVPRMLIFASQGGPLVAPVDEVDGIHGIPLDAVVDPGRAPDLAARQFASGVVQWRERSITLLDEGLLLQAMARSLA
ncbi:purine-binding chemotaxis protein CheW [Pseudomonas sp. JM0905a]|uniref:chemotaxis protein CheW n=1 Tax=Pseudomonas sp. JM0905a TaxID=2772484 RepID=UPI001684CDA1|nr:chemotaxis protein CheW [Pseudomonas sp. JM0905a]MBD2838114.1 purine-binding chemotaxis protein CheW [Pseudomonas sp. JM0905a]